MNDFPDIPDILRRDGSAAVADLPIHPLAEMFPMIDGKEFDELVTSIRDNGLREPIVTHDGAILDGRNRYRACKSAGVAPIFQPFTGRDPIRFVIDKNINRRHLTPSQRAMIIAEFVTFKQGDARSQRLDAQEESNEVESSTSLRLSAPEAADLIQVNRETVLDARAVLREGTPAEIDAVKTGKVGVKSVAKKIRERRPPQDKKSDKKKSDPNAQRVETMRMNAQIWHLVRDALTNLTNLPAPTDVAAIARYSDKSGLVDEKLSHALQWLGDFAHAWRSETADTAEAQDRDDYSDAGDGDRSSGAQSAQQAAA